ncbi:lectin C-type domain protein [Cooperia oncophora]
MGDLAKSDHKALLNPYNAVWIGGRRRQGGRRYSFTWTDGSYFTYTNWAKFEPNDKNHKEDCVAMYHSRIDCKEEMKFLKHWNDLPCDTKLAFGYVCKKKFTKVCHLTGET